MLEADPRAKKEAWRRDLKQIKALGFNAIRCWIDWASGEPVAGQYRSRHARGPALARRGGRARGHRPGLHGLGARVGRTALPGRALRELERPGDPARVVARVLPRPPRRARGRPRLLRGAGAARGGEPGASSASTSGASPTSSTGRRRPTSRTPSSASAGTRVGRFRRWLERKYASLDALNAAWYRRHASWDEVEPNRLSTILSYTDYIDWKSFIAAKLGEDLRARYEAAKRGAPDRVATSHAAGVGLFASPHWWEGQSDDWTMAAQVDYYGTSFYPKHSAFVDRDVEWRGALLDFTRSFGYANGRRGFWIGELQAGFGTIALNVSPTVTPEDLRIWTWSALARGAKAICTYAYYPMSTGYESGGFGLVRLDGTLTERARVAGRHRAAGRPPLGALPRGAAAAVRGGRRLQPARALRGRAPAGRGLRRAAGRGDGHRARLAARRLPGAVSHERAARLRPRRPAEGGRARRVQAGGAAVPADAAGVGRGRAARVRARGRGARGRGARGLERRAGPSGGRGPRPRPRRGAWARARRTCRRWRRARPRSSPARACRG